MDRTPEDLDRWRAMAGALSAEGGVHETREKLDHTLRAYGRLERACAEKGRRVAELEAALTTIRDNCGAVCPEYEVCTHEWCMASYNAWALSDAALNAKADGLPARVVGYWTHQLIGAAPRQRPAPASTGGTSSVNASQNNPTHVFVVNVLDRLDGLYVFMSFACADTFAKALDGAEYTLVEEPLNDCAGTDALVQAERDGDE